jgi:hypothetical protein
MSALLLAPLLAGSMVGAGGTVATQLRPAVDQAATPAGWLPVDFGDAQISVPSSWSLVPAGTQACGPSIGVLVLGDGMWCTTGRGDTSTAGMSIATLSMIRTQPISHERPSALVNGIPIDVPGVAPVYVVPSIGAELAFEGPLQPGVWHTLTSSPRSVVLAPGRSSPVPRSWHWVSFDGLRFAVPASWAVTRSAHAPACGTDIVLPKAGVTLAEGQALPFSCALPLADVRPVPQVAGIEVDGFAASSRPRAPCVGPRMINGLHICLNSTPAYGVLVFEVWSAGITPITVKIGLTKGGTVGRLVLHSIRAS